MRRRVSRRSYSRARTRTLRTRRFALLSRSLILRTFSMTLLSSVNMSVPQPHPIARLPELPQFDVLSHRARLVEVTHPGYSPKKKITLLSLPAYLRSAVPTDDGTLYGVAFCLVLDACRILANISTTNNQGDYIAYDLEGNRRVPEADDTFLEPGEYFYHLGPTHPAKYPIVDKFEAFTFPSALPLHWSRYRDEWEELALVSLKNVSPSDTSHKVISDDGCCVVTKHYNGAPRYPTLTQLMYCHCSLRERISGA